LRGQVSSLHRRPNSTAQKASYWLMPVEFDTCWPDFRVSSQKAV
jgi:hypothetical protein